MTDYSSLTVAQLKDILKARDLPTQGLKANLVERLQKADAEAAVDAPAVAEKTEPAGGTEELKNDKADALQHVGDTTGPSKTGQAVNAGDSVSINDSSVSASVAAPKEAIQRTPVVGAEKAANEINTVSVKPKLSADEMKQTAVAHLTQKIHRARKFGEDESAITSLEKQLARLEKFGLDLTTQLAQELGFGKGPTAALGKKPFKPRWRPSHPGKRYNKQRK